MTTFSEIWSRLELLNDEQRSDVLRFLETRVDHDRAKRRVVASICRSIKSNMSPVAVELAVSKAITRSADQWRELSLLTNAQAKRLEEHQAERTRLANSLKRARSRRRSLGREIQQMLEILEELSLKRSNSEMPPVPAPMVTKEEIGEFEHSFAGVYFVFDQMKQVVYVGESSDIPCRIRNHERVNAGEMVAWIELPPHDRFFAELFYIWATRPSRNREGRKTFHAMKHPVGSYNPYLYSAAAQHSKESSDG